jgi:phytanoyl-CoA hydroxylase
MNTAPLNEIESAAFERDGFLVREKMAGPGICQQMRDVSKSHLEQLIAPIEYEIDVHYPGAPVDPDSPGASTSRRLLQAYARHESFRHWATSASVGDVLGGLFNASDEVMLSQCHHNCVMTKAPGYSSATLWHQDNRYWSFDSENLISVWLALGEEDRTNGCLRVIPGSHKIELPSGRFDSALFLRPDLPENKTLISKAELVPLEAGDVLFFHSRLFHAAGRNLTDETKFSLVFTYHQAGNRPIAATRSAKFPSIRVRRS